MFKIFKMVKMVMVFALILFFAGANLITPLSFVKASSPPNDDFAGRIIISGNSGQVTGNNEGATVEPGEPDHAGAGGNHSVWWEWTAPETAVYKFNTFGSDFDTILAVYTGSSVTSLTEVASNDDAGSGTQSQVLIEAMADTVYMIAVDGWGNETGTIILSWEIANSSIITNDDFAGRIIISGNSGQVTGNNEGATVEPGEPDHAGVGGNHSVWWEWTAPETAVYKFNTFGSDFDTILAVYTGSSLTSLTEVASNDDAGSGTQSQVLIEAMADTVYMIAVDGWGNETGTIILSWEMANSSTITVTGITPSISDSTGTVHITNLAGTGFFFSNYNFRLTRPGEADIVATYVTRVNSNRIIGYLDLTGAAAGAWDVVVTGPEGQTVTLPSGFTVVNTGVTSIMPSFNTVNSIVEVNYLSGFGFETGADVRLTREGQPDIVADSVQVISQNRITCSFDLTGARANTLWNVVVTNPGGEQLETAATFCILREGLLGYIDDEHITIRYTGNDINIYMLWYDQHGNETYFTRDGSGSWQHSISIYQGYTLLGRENYFMCGESLYLHSYDRYEGLFGQFFNDRFYFHIDSHDRTPGLYRADAYAGTLHMQRDYFGLQYSPGQPDAQFTASAAGGNTPLTVAFDNLSTGVIHSWEWDFGDGSTSTLQNPLHTYITPGAHTVTLTVTGPDGSDTEAKVNYITVEGTQNIIGDIDGNEVIDVADAILVLRYIVGLIELELHQLVAANVSGCSEGTVDVSDAILILRRIVGLIDRFPVE